MAANEDPIDAQVEPDPAQYDPMAEVCWTLPMAVAWIRWRRPDEVRQEWNIWLEQQGRRRASLAFLVLRAQGAWRALHQALYQGAIAADGIRIKSGRSGKGVSIPANEWKYLTNYPTGPDLIENFRYPDTSQRRGYDDILLNSADVQRLWPTGSTEAAMEEGKVREKRKPGPRDYYDWKAIETAAREIAAKPLVPGSTPPIQRLIEAIQKWHEKQHPDARVPSRSALQRRLDEWELP